MVAEQSAGGNGGHASVQTVESKRAVQEVGRAFARAADAAELDDLFRHDVQFIHCADDLVRDRVVSAALAERGRVSAVIIFRKAGKVHVCIGGRASHREWLCHDNKLLFSTSWKSSARLPFPFAFTGAMYLARMPSRTHLAEAGMPSPTATDLKNGARCGYSMVNSWFNCPSRFISTTNT